MGLKPYIFWLGNLQNLSSKGRWHIFNKKQIKAVELTVENLPQHEKKVY